MNRWVKSLSVKGKLILLMVSVSTSTLIVSAITYYINHIELLEKSLIKNSQTQALLIGDSIKSSLIFKNPETAHETINSLDRDPSIEFVAVLLPDKTTFSQYSRSKKISAPKIDINQEWSISSKYIDVTLPVEDLHERIGYIFIRSNLNELKTIKKEYTEILVSVLFLGVLMAYFLAHSSQAILTRPLSRMVRYVEDISKTKDYKKRLDIDHNNELGILIQGFHRLLDIVADRELKLKKHSDNLQEIVDQRTEELYEKAHFDSLTELPNRSLLLDRLDHAIQNAKRDWSQLAVLFLDLDRFKIINDTLGHDIGDELLKQAAKRLIKSGRDADTVARLGGDEFVFLIEHIKSPNDAAHLALRIINLFEKPFHVGSNVLHVSTSIGISLYPDDGDTSQLLLKNADVSMYHSKESSLGGYTFYEEELNNSSHERLSIENKLRHAIENDEFYLVYQPKVNIRNNQVNHLEALLRWSNPELGNVSPDTFISIAEEMGIIKQIGMWVISEACRQLDEWEKNGLFDISIAVNISASHLIGTDLINHFRNESENYNITCDKLEVEITENVFLDHAEETINVLTELQGLGIKIAIDDFGTGYSSLRYLKNLPVDTLKLDGMFINDLSSNSASLGIVSSTIILAHSLNMEIVAECVETQEQLDILKEHKCDLVQGYLLYKPMKASEIEAIRKDAINYSSLPTQ